MGSVVRKSGGQNDSASADLRSNQSGTIGGSVYSLPGTSEKNVAIINGQVET